MNFCHVLLLLLVGLSPAFAQEGAPRPAIPSPIETYAAMPLAERTAIQSDLLWTGHYDGMVDGDFSDREIDAIRRFQRNNKSKQTGVLNPKERDVLTAAARKEREAVGWRVVEDAPSGSRVGLPSKLLPQWVKNKLGSRWSSEHGEAVMETFRIAGPGASLAAVFYRQRHEPERKVEASELSQDSFVMRGLHGLKKFYARAVYKDGEVRGITVLYDPAMDGTMAKIADAARSAFVPFWRHEITGGIKARVEYGTGIVVSAAGHILTPQHVVEDCAVLTAAGLGNAEAIAEDAGKGLALLRVYGRQLTALALAAEPKTEPKTGTDVTLVGVADPKAQAGGSAASVIRAKLGAAGANGLRRVEAAPAPGFSGAAVLDGSKRLIGMLQAKPQVMAEAGAAKFLPPAALIPADSMRDFLVAQGVEPPSAVAGAGEANASVTRIICVRK